MIFTRELTDIGFQASTPSAAWGLCCLYFIGCTYVAGKLGVTARDALKHRRFTASWLNALTSFAPTTRPALTSEDGRAPNSASCTSAGNVKGLVTSMTILPTQSGSAEATSGRPRDRRQRSEGYAPCSSARVRRGQFRL
jgi:hypothetical protein